MMQQTPVTVRNTWSDGGNKLASAQLCNCHYSNLANHPCSLSSIPEPSNIVSDTISNAVGHAALLTICKRCCKLLWRREQCMTSAYSVFSWDKVGACTPAFLCIRHIQHLHKRCRLHGMSRLCTVPPSLSSSLLMTIYFLSRKTT